MPDSDLVVSDTSPLLNLALIERLDLLESQFSGLTIPNQVWEELARGENGLDALRALRERGFLSGGRRRALGPVRRNFPRAGSR